MFLFEVLLNGSVYTVMQLPDSMSGAWEWDWLMDWERRLRKNEGKGRTDSSGQTDINIACIEDEEFHDHQET